MADTAITKEDVLAGLQDIRLPVDAPGGVMAEIAAATGVGLLAALLISLLLPLITKRIVRGSAKTPEAFVEALRDLPEEDRALALLKALKARHPKAPIFTAALYAQDGLPEIAALEAAYLNAEAVNA